MRSQTKKIILFSAACLYFLVSPTNALTSTKTISTEKKDESKKSIDKSPSSEKTAKDSEIIATQNIEKIKSMLPTDKAKKLKSFVDLGIGYIAKVGKEKAFIELSKPKQGMFNQNEIYFFAYDNKGNCLVHGLHPQRIGKNYSNEQDEHGHPLSVVVSELAKTGGGFISFRRSSQVRGKTIYTASYVEAIDDNSYIGATFREELKTPETQNIRIEKLKKFVNSAADYYKKYGRENAFKEFDDVNGKFRQKDRYLFVIDYDGTMLAYNGDSKIKTGENVYKKMGEFGTLAIQLFIQTAKSGEGLISYYWIEPTTKETKLKISYVKPLDKNILIGSGIYLD